MICASAGNHAQGVALSAHRLGSRAVIVMPVTTPQLKVDAVKALGGEVVMYGDSYSDAHVHALELEQAQDRFRAGVSSTIELVQAQEAVARATEAHIARVYEHAVARGRLARVRGDVEHSFVAAAGGQQQ